MNFINVDRAVQPVPLPALLHPFRILPLMLVGWNGEGGGAGTQFIALGVRIGFGQQLAGVAVAYLIAVQRVLLDLGNEQFPYSAGAMRTHRDECDHPS